MLPHFCHILEVKASSRARESGDTDPADGWTGQKYRIVRPWMWGQLIRNVPSTMEADTQEDLDGSTVKFNRF